MPSTSANRDFAVDVVSQLQAAGHKAVWAGGCVRDQMLGLEPKDYDIATSAVPDEVRAVFGKSRTWAVGEAFGVIVVRGPRGADQIEVATFRIDGGYSDGRRPDSVEFSSAEEDAKRRDFTINGMFYDPLADRIIDYVDGRADLERRIVRAIGDPDARFTDDKLRMLRAVRFAAKFEFELEPATLQAIQRRPADIQIVSGERIGMEMTRMLTSRQCRQAIEMLETSGLLEQVLPQAIPALTNQRDSVLAAIDHATKNGTEAIQLPVALGCLLKDWQLESTQEFDARAVTQDVAERWKLSNQDKSMSRWLLENESLIRRAREVPWPTVQRVLVNENARMLIDLAASIVAGTHSDSESQSVTFCQEKIVLDPALWNPPPLLTGDDLRERGIPPGPIFRELLDQVRDAQLNGEVDDQAQAWQLVSTLLKN